MNNEREGNDAATTYDRKNGDDVESRMLPDAFRSRGRGAESRADGPGS